MFVVIGLYIHIAYINLDKVIVNDNVVCVCIVCLRALVMTLINMGVALLHCLRWREERKKSRKDMKLG